MSFVLSSGSEIALGVAKFHSSSFRTRSKDVPISLCVGHEKLNLILEQQNSLGIRLYNIFNNEKNRDVLLLLSLNAKGKDLTESRIVEKLLLCPESFDFTSKLLTD